MKNIGKRVSSFVFYTLCVIITTYGKNHTQYYSMTSKEKQGKQVFIGIKSIRENDGRVRVEKYNYSPKDDIITSIKEAYYRKSDSTLIRYASREDTLGQIYLKIQQDTSFVYKYEDPVTDDFLGTAFRYIGKEVSRKNGKETILYKFRGDRYEVVLDVYLDENFYLERIESIIESYFHYKMERIDSKLVPKSFRLKVENYESGITLGKSKKTLVIERRKCTWINCLYVAIFLGLPLFIACIFCLIRIKRRHTDKEST